MKKFRTYREEIDPSKKATITKKDINWDAKSNLLKKKPAGEGSTREPSQARVRESFTDWLNARCR